MSEQARQATAGSAGKKITHLSSVDGYNEYINYSEDLIKYKIKIGEMLVQDWAFRDTLPGISSPTGRMVNFLIDPSLRLNGGAFNLRETVNCPETFFNTRMRAVIQAIKDGGLDVAASYYMMEQKTPLFRYFKGQLPRLVGSEFLGDGIPLGESDADGLRNEDATRLTFRDNSFDVLLSFDVLEHIPDYLTAFREARRVLRPGGCFYFTAPFIPKFYDHSIRARIEDGNIVHLLEPEWHGDPVTGEGILCFQHFGWKIVEEMKSVGFSEVSALVFDQVEYGYYTPDPILVFKAIG